MIAGYRFSRRIMWIHVAVTNNKPAVIAGYFADCIKALGVLIKHQMSSESGTYFSWYCKHPAYKEQDSCSILKSTTTEEQNCYTNTIPFSRSLKAICILEPYAISCEFRLCAGWVACDQGWIQTCQKVGRGSFGTVHLGKYKGTSVTVKEISRNSSRCLPRCRRASLCVVHGCPKLPRPTVDRLLRIKCPETNQRCRTLRLIEKPLGFVTENIPFKSAVSLLGIEGDVRT